MMMPGTCMEENATTNNLFAQIRSQPLIRNSSVREDELNLTDSRLRRLLTIGATACRDTKGFVGRDKEIGGPSIAFGDAFVIRLFGKSVPTEYTLQDNRIGIGKAISRVC